ncbi:FGGY-family carbohydrate kinase [Staphylococcus kloosii]|uniref:xylulokinase n=1 Tax=Staphylococcus kloosii TaxID=29384 RepID=UPI0028A45291|nr:FGGY-family carbohydrate kinase [Staphylococcus kloosii]MDT3959004.1 FGGY-family carbohydrate kinase [Staphylococcus kloosii]
MNNLNSEELSIGIELGSTRIKTIAIDKKLNVRASGSFQWENKFVDGFWTYSANDIWVGLQQSYGAMAQDLFDKTGVTLTKVNSIGISAMMHGYLAFDNNDDLLVPFRTWRNGNTKEAAKKLTDIFNFNIPERWSIAHIYQAILNKESHTSQVEFITTLSGYIHWYLTGEKVIGLGDASGMFPVDISTNNYRQDLLSEAQDLFATHGFGNSIESILPQVKLAGEFAGRLTEIGAKLLDPTEKLESGCILCPPEGDAATGMVATKSITANTGNISAGTSAFAMIVLNNKLQNYYPEVDVVTTPDGKEVAMIHVNNCTSDINDWMNLFSEVLETMGVNFSSEKMYGQIFETSLSSDDDLGGLLSYNYISGENITDVDVGHPLFIRLPNNNFNLANFMKMHLYSAFSTLKIGIDLLQENENINLSKLIAHGGIFKTKNIAQQVLSSALQERITVMDTASEGGAWGISILGYYAALDEQITLEQFLNEKVFINTNEVTIEPNDKEVQNFQNYLNRMKRGLKIERDANYYLGDDKNARATEARSL